MRATLFQLARRVVPLWFLGLFALSGCLPTSEEPILAPGQPALDERLLGVWFGALEEGEDPAFLHFLKVDSNREETHPNGMDIVMVLQPDEPDGDTGWAVFYALSAQIAGQNYLSIEFRLDSGEEVTDEMRGYHLFSTHIDDDGILTLLGVDEDLVEEAIESGALKGDLDEGTFLPQIRIPSSSEELAAFLGSEEARTLFTRVTGPFRRTDL